MNGAKAWFVILVSMILMVGASHQAARGVSYVLIDGEIFLETTVPDTVEVTADCAQPGNRVTAEIYLDLNDNGLVDANETLVQFVYLNDGIPTLENEWGDKIPGDDDAQVNGLLRHELELLQEDYSFATIPMQFVIKLIDQDRSTAEAVLRLLPPESSRPYIGGTVSETGSGAALDNMVVVAYETTTQDYRATLSSGGGRYVLDVTVGEWVVYAWDLQNYYAPADSQSVAVAAQDSAVADFILGPYPAYITGKVDSTGSKPVPSVMVVAVEESYDTWVGWTQADGNYRIGVTPGTYDIYPMFLPSGYASNPASYLGVVANSGATISGKDFHLERPDSRIQGRVTYQAGGGASGVTIRAFSMAGYNYTTVTDEDGDYSLAVQAASYILSAELAGYQVTSPVTGIYFPVTVQLGQTLTGYDFVIAPTGGGPASISGTVTYRDSGQPAEGVYVVIYNDEENSSLGWHFAETDADGYYQFGDIISGTWFIGVYQPGYGSDPLLREASVFFGVSATDQDFELVTGTSVPQAGDVGLPGSPYLFPNFPNPFNDGTLIAYTLSGERSEDVTLKIFNVLGQEVRTLVDEPQTAGLHLVRWDGGGANGLTVAAGVYFCELRGEGHRQVRKMILLR